MNLLVDIEKKLGAFTLHAQFETSGGIMTPDRGRIVLDGKTLFDSEARVNLTPQQRRVGYLFQQYALFPNMTVMQNILCGVRSGTKAERRRKVQDSLRRFRLEGLEKKYPAQFSGGQQQRVALARTLNQNPSIILADEPVAALDPVTAHQVMADFKRINEEMNITILINIHHVDLALGYAQRVVGIRAGEIVYDGPASEVTQEILDSIYNGSAVPQAGGN